MQMIDVGTTRGGERTVAVLLSAPAERLLIDTCALLSREFPKVGGPAFNHAVAGLRSQFRQEAPAVLTGLMLLLSAMGAAGRLPKLRLGRGRSAGKADVLFVALLAAAQTGDKGRAIEAAIALLDTAHVHDVIVAARAVAKRLAEHGMRLRPIGAATFDYVAGYPAAADTAPAPQINDAEVPRRPVLTLLKSA